jgi:hypothetical protein
MTMMMKTRRQHWMAAGRTDEMLRFWFCSCSGNSPTPFLCSAKRQQRHFWEQLAIDFDQSDLSTKMSVSLC